MQHLMQDAVEQQALADQPHDLLEQQKFLRVPDRRRGFAAAGRRFRVRCGHGLGQCARSAPISIDF
jgi:hypothetical protein